MSSRSSSSRRSPACRRIALTALALTLPLAACADGATTGPTGPGGPSAIAAAVPARLAAGSYYLRTVDGRPLPVALADGSRLESGFVVADSLDARLVGWGESLTRGSGSSVRLAAGTALVLGEAPDGGGRLASITWQNAAASRDSVTWGRDSVVVHRTGAGPSLAGAGRRLVYTRATSADML